MRSTALPVLLLAIASTSFAPSAHATSGDLDPAFGDGGIARAAFGGSAASSLARQPDGKLVVAGAAGSYETAAIAVARFDAAGVPDPTFNGSGRVTTDVGPFHDGSVQVLIQPDGKIVVIGTTSTSADDSDSAILLLRYNDDGTLDAGFGSGGMVITDLGVGTDVPYGGTLQSDGKIVVVGGAVGTNTPSDEFVIRYDDDGTLDTTFGTLGVVTLDFGGRGDGGRAVLVQPDGMIVVAGTSFNGPLFSDGAVATLTRLDTTGTPDPGFGSGGSVVFSPQPITIFNAVVRQPDGKLVVLGLAGAAFRLFRFDDTGAPDGGFVGDVIPFFLTNINPQALALAADGKFVVTGFSTPGFHVARMNADGSLDADFAIGGSITEVVGLNSTSQAVVVEPSLDIVLAGTATKAATDDYEATLVRVLGTSPACATDADCGLCERCGGAGTCAVGERSGCATAATGKAKFALLDAGLKKAALQLTWRGAVPAVDPTTTDDIGVCMYQLGKRLMKVVAPAGGTCGSSPCWSGSFATKLKYKDREGTPHGVRTALISSGKIKLKAQGAELRTSPQGVPSPVFLGPLSAPVVLQTHASNGTCTTATFDTKRKMKADRVKGKSE